MKKILNFLISKVEDEPEVVTQQGNTIFYRQKIQLKELQSIPFHNTSEGNIYHVKPPKIEDLKFEYINIKGKEIDVKRASEITGVSPKKLQEWCRKELFECRKDKKWIINVTSLNEFLSLIVE